MTTWQPDISKVDYEGALTLVVGWRRGHRIESGRVEVEEAVEAFLREVATSHLEKLEEMDSKQYSVEAALEPGEEFMIVQPDQLPTDNGLLESLANAGELKQIKARTLPDRSLIFYAIVVGDDPSSRTCFLRKTNPATVPATGKLMTRLGQSLKQVRSPILTFDSRIDVVVLTDGLIVTSLSQFRQLFDDLPELLAQVPDWLQEIGKYLPMSASTLEQLEQMTQQGKRLRRRLQSINARGHLASVSLDQIAEEARLQGIDPDLLIEEGEMVIDNVGADDLLKLLNEDLMTGGLSGQRFAVDRKSPRG